MLESLFFFIFAINYSILTSRKCYRLCGLYYFVHRLHLGLMLCELKGIRNKRFYQEKVGNDRHWFLSSKFFFVRI